MDDVEIESLPEEKYEEPQGSLPNQEPIEHMVLAPYFQVEGPDESENNKLAEIWRHAKAISPTGDTIDVIHQVKHMEQVLGAPRLGEARLDRLYRYAKLRRQEAMIQDELRSV